MKGVTTEIVCIPMASSTSPLEPNKPLKHLQQARYIGMMYKNHRYAVRGKSALQQAQQTARRYKKIWARGILHNPERHM
jgi:hypothetical protein